jgi:hypothetical protein
LAPRATSSACFTISSAPTHRRAAICRLRWKCPTSRRSFARKIEDLLALADKKLQPDQFSGFAQTRLRYQSNARLGAGSQTVLASGGTINSNFLARPDWNWFGTVGLSYGQNGAGTFSTITNFMRTILNWYTPPGPPVQIPLDLAIHNINIVSSVNGQTGGGLQLHGLPTTGFACGTNSTPPCSWSPTNTGENDALQLLIEATKLATQPNPPPPQIIETGSLAHPP